MAINDIWEFKLSSRFGSTIQCLNVFRYQSLGSVDVSVAPSIVATALWTKIGAALKAVTSNQMLYQEVYVKNLNTLVEGVDTLAGTEDGDLPDDALPPFNAFSFRYQRANATTRHGHKRFAGVPESKQANGIVTDATQLTNLNTLAAALGAPLDDGDGLNASAELWPVIYSQYLNGELRPTPVINLVSAVLYTGIGSQNTRKS